jgi:putative tricarboxylic transport membrane protein
MNNRLSMGLPTIAPLLALMLTVSMTTPAWAQEGTWKPDKPVEIVIGATPGGAQDRTGRTMQKVLQNLKLVPTAVTVVNKGGGNGTVALAYMSHHPGEGHLLMIVSMSVLTNHIVGRSTLGPSDITPIAIMGSEYIGVLVRPESPLKNGKDLVDLLRKQPDALSVAVGLGLGSTLHISFASAMKAAGVDIKKLRTVVFGSGGEATTALLGGHLDATVSTVSNLMPYIHAGRMRMLVIGAPERLPGEFSDVPTWRELGVPGTYELWRGFAGPRNMSRQQIEYWDTCLAKVVKSDEWQRDIKSSYMVNTYENSAATARYWKRQYDEAKVVLKELGFAK